MANVEVLEGVKGSVLTFVAWGTTLSIAAAQLLLLVRAAANVSTF